MKLFFLIRTLGHGGAQRQLTELVKRLDPSRFRVTVATFYDGGGLRPEIEGLPGIRVVSLGKRGRWDWLPFFWRLLRLVRETKPDIIHGYMGVSNELATLLGWAFGPRVVWGLRQSQIDHTRHDWATKASFRVGAWLSRFPDLMIANSHSGRADYVADGYRADRLIVISNGIDTARFRPDPTARERVRREWGVRDDERVIGLVGRLQQQKDHPTFLRAASILALRQPRVRFACVGDGTKAYCDQLEALARELHLAERMIWVRASNDMTGVHNACDLATLSSAYGEGFANVIGEAMACGVPVVATDTGDSAMIIGNPAQLAPPRNPGALAAAWERMLALSAPEGAALGRAQRERIVSEFSLEKLAQKTVAALEGIA